ncbi:MAG: hypothetical protein A2Y98_00535 [Candidatus Portnoybacteria bacterium RBG_19FT_COMBO_36_7]|uniref:Uncharacterized protein n=1 Tax=Candidatus Portnoybacteria bacterium RBG_19FT_COMBO_36_7 TaxID=1801992 RepID=A0A1G2F7R8_9BACT|nr:MAG: hypothetical protein A2Y98_00535 [Candidatus Portnoybacteria bacterium RBG_19FT_COMBO_36_7]
MSFISDKGYLFFSFLSIKKEEGIDMGTRKFAVKAEEILVRKWPNWVAKFWTKACRYPLILGVLLKIFKEMK